MTEDDTAEGHIVRRRLHLTSAPEGVYHFLATGEGRARFWAESAVERGGGIAWRFPNGLEGDRGWSRDAPRRFAAEVLDGSIATFELAGDGAGGTDLALCQTSPELPYT